MSFSASIFEKNDTLKRKTGRIKGKIGEEKIAKNLSIISQLASAGVIKFWGPGVPIFIMILGTLP